MKYRGYKFRMFLNEEEEVLVGFCFGKDKPCVDFKDDTIRSLKQQMINYVDKEIEDEISRYDV
jgi:hypothetical protein